jgi:hypothetical protein
MAYEEITNEVPVDDAGSGDLVSSPETTEPDPIRIKAYKRWLHRIRAARKLRKDWETEFQVETCEDFYLGKQQKGLPPGIKVINHFLATVNVTLPGLLFDSPKFLARSKAGKSSPQSAENAKLAEGVLDSISSQDDNLQNAAKFGLLQNFWRIGVLKCIYDPSIEPNPRSGTPIFQTDSAGNTIRDPMSLEPAPMVDPETGEAMVEPEEVMSDETYRWEWVDARGMLLPDDGPDMAKWTWIGEEIEVDLEDAKEDVRFPAELRELFKDAGKREDDKHLVSYNDKDDGVDENYEPCFRYVECYDLKKKRWYILTEQSDIHEFLLDMPLPDGVEDHPYAILPGWLPNTGPKPSPWPLPFVNPWLDLQREYNIRRQQMMDGAKRSARKIIYEKNTFEDADEALKGLQSNKDMEGVMVMDLNRPPTPMQEAPLNSSITNDVPALLMDWRIITGQTGAKMGQSDSDTATEATFVERASNLRDAELQKAVLRWLKTAGCKMWQLVRATLTLQLFVKLRGMDDNAVKLYLSSTFGIPPELSEMFPEIKRGLVDRFGQETIEPVSREDLQFEADIDIVPSSTKPRNLTVERQQWLEFLGLLAQAPQLALSRALLEETAAKFDFISPQMVEEIHALAITMMQQQTMAAGHGGDNPQTGKGSAESKKNGNMSQASQGTEML